MGWHKCQKSQVDTTVPEIIGEKRHIFFIIIFKENSEVFLLKYHIFKEKCMIFCLPFGATNMQKYAGQTKQEII